MHIAPYTMCMYQLVHTFIAEVQLHTTIYLELVLVQEIFILIPSTIHYVCLSPRRKIRLDLLLPNYLT